MYLDRSYLKILPPKDQENCTNLGMVVHAYKPSTWEVVAERSR